MQPTPPFIRLAKLSGALAAGLALLACASAPPPAPALAAAAASVEAARAANASELAATDMQRARQKLERAHALAQAGHDEPAVRLAEQADADAQLARARADAQRSRRAVDEVENGLRTLREETSRSRVTAPVVPPAAVPDPRATTPSSNAPAQRTQP